MRRVSGFERPAVQWIFIALAVVLIVLVAGEAVVVRRQRAELNALRADNLNARLERQQLEIRFAREQSAREALSMEVARLRGSAAAPAAAPPTLALTLTPLTTRAATPPAPSVEPPSAGEVIDLRLVLPRGAAARAKTCTVTVRRWSTGEVVWTRGGLPLTTVDGRPAVVARTTGDVLAVGSYEILLTATAGAGPSIDIAAYEVSVGPGH